MSSTDRARRPRLAELAARYPGVVVVLLAGVVAGALALAGQPDAAAFVGSAAALGIALVQAIGMIREFRAGHWGLDVLALLAIGSTVAVGDPWAALVVALMITGGEALEDYAGQRARRQVTALLERAPQLALRVRGAETVEVPVESVVPGEVLLVPPGGVVPVDGELLDAGEFDESSITGESLPVARPAGDEVPSGAVNGGTAVRVRAVAASADSQYQRIVALVEGAAESRSRYVRIADRVAVPFTVVAVAIALIAWLVSGDPVRIAEVLVLATPCPLLIAAPAAFVAGMGRAAKEGVIVKDGETLERLATLRTVAVDKTGTLTLGRPAVERVEVAPGSTEAEVLGIAAGLESASSHVLARAIVDAAATRGVVPAEVRAVTDETGFGLRGRLGEREVAIGRAGFVADSGESSSVSDGETAVLVALDGRGIGRVVLRDPVRPDAAATVAELRSLGAAHVVMLTGDLPGTAAVVAGRVGIDDVRAELLPGDKAAAVAALPDRPVLMVGDGVNDAPVLAAADVGVAMGARGATAAGESADAVVLVDAIHPVAAAVRTARRTRRIATQSVAIGVGLSVAGMLVAAFGVVPALAGALVQEAIDIVTILNGLRAAGGGRRAGGAAASPEPAQSPTTSAV